MEKLLFTLIRRCLPIISVMFLVLLCHPTFSQGEWKYKGFKEEIRGDNILDISEDLNGNIWILTNNGGNTRELINRLRWDGISRKKKMARKAVIPFCPAIFDDWKGNNTSI